MKNVLITGITGSGGSYLAEYIVNNHKDYNVYGLHRWHSAGTLVNIEHFKDKITIIESDLLDLSSVIRALQICKPEKIFHLAAFANVRKCFDTPLAVINNNIIGTANLLEAIKMVCPEATVQMCSTSEVYGNPLTFPMTEEHPKIPINPYAVSKLSSEQLGYCYFKSWGLKVITTRMFAYINPRRHDLFASAFARQVASIEKGKQEPVIYHGNLDSIRTLIDVRDAMRTYWIASEMCIPGEAYNIGGREVLSVGDVLKMLVKLSRVPIKTALNKDLLRPVDVTKQIPDTYKFDNLTNWSPCYKIEETLDFLLDNYRKE